MSVLLCRNGHNFSREEVILAIKKQEQTMKFAAGVFTALSAAGSIGGAFAFAPQSINGASSTTTSMFSTAADTPTYTFKKSEEIFAEALEVRSMILIN